MRFLSSKSKFRKAMGFFDELMNTLNILHYFGLDLRAIRHEKVYQCCVETFIDLTFTCTVQRKPLFYIVNLIVPCVNISVLAVLVFLLPSDSRKKITLSISILVALLVFYLLLIELIPPTSLVIPLLGKYLLFTLVLVNLSIILTIITLNVHFRRYPTNLLPKWLRLFLICYLPKILFMERPPKPNKPSLNYEKNNFSSHFFSSDAILEDETSFSNLNCTETVRSNTATNHTLSHSKNKHTTTATTCDHQQLLSSFHTDECRQHLARVTADHIDYIAEQMKHAKLEKEIAEDWRFIALVLDRLFLIIFAFVSVVGTLISLLKAPSIYNQRKPVDPYCYLYYPPINDSIWTKRCITELNNR
ncbi:unnamed protein product [Didymodactylos carnosus]|uniref:Neurotransmitter-gated ion-channel transmembrane domain-containing protein n=1 Tax=Didymodactylos carnosus TaxID=1234261 RepID=A0A8S2IAL4_9BILA|nr:unnamed protein product [Didymodactylos carnosus]CAF3721675.1 unnamed protein product [Didymodactylos carnosus]